jgi:hypothetical protein
MQQLIAPIVTLYPLPEPASKEAAPVDTDSAGQHAEAEMSSKETPETPPNAAVAAGQDDSTASQAILCPLPDKGWTVRIDFWYMSKRSRRFVRVVPEVWSNDRLPGLSPVAWHLAQPRRFDQEHHLLTGDGYVVDTVRWDADGSPPLEICFSVFRPGSSRVILLVTSVDYPVTRPAVRIAPLVSVAEDEDMFERLYEASTPVPGTDLPDWEWDSKRTLLELVWYVEKTFKEGSGS